MNVITHDVQVADVSGQPELAASCVVDMPGGIQRLNLMVQNVHCSGCIQKIERTLHATPGIVRARVNLSTKRLVVEWQPSAISAPRVINMLADLGFPATPYDPQRLQLAGGEETGELLKALAVAGFAAANIMLLSVSVWAGYNNGMGEATRAVFHWLSALIALPVVVYAGMPFYRSALTALRAGSLNMDVPISLAVVLASGMSLYQTINGGQHTYFDAAVTLLFFLLVGRYLDRHARAKARSAAEQLVTLTATNALVVQPGGALRSMPVDQLSAGMAVVVAAGERIPVDGDVQDGASDVDASLVTGESLPVNASTGTSVYAGTLNLSQPLTISITKAGDDTLLSEIVRLMEAAEQGRARYVRLADRVAALYAPVVHILAAATFAGWMMFGNAGWEVSLMVAIAVLIITCPCAMGLAVPAVQVVATGRLLQHGVLLKTPDGLERLAAADTVVFDKTGTLTTGELHLENQLDVSNENLALAAALAQFSRHPVSRSITRIWGDQPVPETGAVLEVPGCGLEAEFAGKRVRLGKADWCGAVPGEDNGIVDGLEIWLTMEDAHPCRMVFRDQIRPDAKDAVMSLKQLGLDIALLSGDRASHVARVARSIGITNFLASQMPADKAAYVHELAQSGRKVLMVGDGINDAPALATGHVSMSPASAADISQSAADLVFQGGTLTSIPASIMTARSANRLVMQNFSLALLYNVIAAPLAMAGLATPLLAAIAMSSSSIIVTLNALRLRLFKWRVMS